MISTIQQLIQQSLQDESQLNELQLLCQQTLQQISEIKQKEKICKHHVWRVDLSSHDEHSYSYCIHCQKQQLTLHCK